MADELFNIQGRITADVSGLQEALRSAAESTGRLAESFEGLKDAATNALGGLGLALSFEELAKSSLEAFASVERARISITALTGDADMASESIDRLKTLAISDALSFPALLEANQRLVAFGISADLIPQVLRAAGDAAAATNHSFEQTANSLERISLSGMLSGRQLVNLGISVKDVAQVMGVAEEQAKLLFQAMDQEGRVAVLTEALQKFQGTAQQVAQGLSGQWTILQNQIHLAFEEIGQRLAPVALEAMHMVSASLPALTEVVSEFVALGATDLVRLIASLATIHAALREVAVDLGLVKENTSSVKELVDYIRDLVPGMTAALTLLHATASALRISKGESDPLKELLDLIKGLSPSATSGIPALEALRKALAESGDEYSKIKQILGDTNKEMDLGAIIAKALAEAQAKLEQQSLKVVDVTEQIRMAMELLGQGPNPFESLDKEADKLYRHFLDIGLGIDEFRDSVSSGVDFGRMVDELTSLRDRMIEAGAEGSLGFVQVNDALKLLNERLFETGALFNKTDAEIQKIADDELKKLNAGFGELILKTGGENLKKPIDEFNASMMRLGVTMDGTGVKARQALADFDTILKNPIADVSLLEEAWERVEMATRRMAQDPAGLQRIIQLEGELLGKLQELGAPLGDQLDLQAKIYQQEISLAERQGQDATAQIIALTNVQLAQQVLYDKTHALGDLYRDLTKIFNDMWGKFSEGIATAIVDGKSWGDTFLNIGKQIEKEIIEGLVNYALKMLKNAILENTNLLGQMAGVFTNIFGGAAGGAMDAGRAATGAAGSALGGAGAGVSAALGGVTGIVGAVGAIGTMVSSIIGNFQMARQETSLNAIELNTRQVAMFIGGLGDGGVQTWTRMTQDNTYNLYQAFSGWFHDSFAALLSTEEQILEAMHASGGGGSLKPLAVAPNAGGTVNISIMTKGGNARDIAREVVREIPAYLKSVSPKFSE